MITQPASFRLLSGSSGGRVTGNTLGLLVLPHGWSCCFFTVSLQRDLQMHGGQSVGYCSTGTADVRHKSVYQLQSCQHGTMCQLSNPAFLAQTPISQNQICFMRHTDCLPVRAHMLIQLCVNKDLLGLLIMLQNEPGALSKCLVEDGWMVKRMEQGSCPGDAIQ